MTTITKTITLSKADVESILKETLRSEFGSEPITVEFVIREVDPDPLDRYPGTPGVTEVKVSGTARVESKWGNRSARGGEYIR